MQRRGLKSQLEQFPQRTVSKRNVDSIFRARVKQSALLRVLSDGSNERALWDSVGQPRPGLAVIARFIEVRFEIVALMPVHGQVSRARVVRRSIDLADAAPLRQTFGRDVRPALSFVARQLHQTI